jgi:hypothetical protein
MSATKRVRVSGNPVGIGDGCATVSGDKLSETTGLRAGKVKVRFEAASQDTGSEVLVRALPRKGRVCFSAKEKDEAKFAPGA